MPRRMSSSPLSSSLNFSPTAGSLYQVPRNLFEYSYSDKRTFIGLYSSFKLHFSSSLLNSKDCRQRLSSFSSTLPSSNHQSGFRLFHYNKSILWNLSKGLLVTSMQSSPSLTSNLCICCSKPLNCNTAHQASMVLPFVFLFQSTTASCLQTSDSNSFLVSLPQSFPPFL